MRKIIKYGTVVLLFIGVNLYLGIHLIGHFKEFRLKNAPIGVDVINDEVPAIAAIVDIDKDGIDEIMFQSVEQFPDKKKVWIFNPGNKKNADLSLFAGKISLSLHSCIFDAYLDKSSNSCVFRLLDYENGDFVLKEVDHLGETRTKRLFEEISYKLIGVGFGFSNPVFVDLESDGNMEMLIIFQSYYRHTPRGVVCFDPGTGKLLWEYYMGTMAETMEIGDLDGDGKKEIIISTFGINNGAERNGTDDAHSYVIVLDHKGKQRWKKETGDWYSRSQSVLADLDNDGHLEIVTATASHRVHPQVKGKLFILDGVTGEEDASFSLPHASFSRPFVYTSGEGNNRIFVCDATGCIRMLDHRLNLLKTIQGPAPGRVLNALTLSIEWPFLAVVTHEQLAAFDWDLEGKMFNYRFEHPFHRSENFARCFFSPFRTPQGSGALLRSKKLLWLREIEVSFFRKVGNAVTSELLLVFCGLVLFNVFFVYAVRRMNTSSTGFRREGVGETSRFLRTVQEIAQQNKNPASIISWTAEKIKQNIDALPDTKTRQSYAQLSDFLAEDGNLLKQQANHLLRLVQIYRPRFRRAALKRFLQHLVDHYRTVMAENIRIRLEMEEDITLSFDEELFKQALVNLVENAIDAVPPGKGGQLTVSAVPVTSPLRRGVTQVLIEIEDTGCGIHESDLPNVFHPFFTRKEKGKGTGIGLFICKRIIEAHQGKIEIYSRKNFGTKVTITLPVKRKRKLR
jgi:signal transduction histidine kinase